MKIEIRERRTAGAGARPARTIRHVAPLARTNQEGEASCGRGGVGGLKSSVTSHVGVRFSVWRVCAVCCRTVLASTGVRRVRGAAARPAAGANGQRRARV